MILNSYSLQKAILMNKRRQQYNDMKTIIPKNNIYTSLTSTIIQKSEYVEKTGFVDLIVERKDLASKIGTLLSILLKQNSVISFEENETSEDSQSLTKAAS